MDHLERAFDRPFPLKRDIMMKIKLYVARSGPDGAFDAGAVIDVGYAEAVRMVDAGHGEVSDDAELAAARVRVAEDLAAVETAVAAEADEAAVPADAAVETAVAAVAKEKAAK